MGAKAKRRSITEEEHHIRVRFDAAHDERRDDLWPDLVRARGKGTKRLLLVMAHLRENHERTGWWLVSDLQGVKWDRPRPNKQLDFICATAPCDLVFDTMLPPCEREGECPHLVAVYVDEFDNTTHRGRRAMRNLREQAGPQPQSWLG